MSEVCWVEQQLDDSGLAQNDSRDGWAGDRMVSAIGAYKDSLAGYKGIVEATSGKLNELQSLTEEVFLEIGEKLPDINIALRNTDEEADRLLTYFRKESGLIAGASDAESSDLKKLNHASSYLIKVVAEQGDAFLQMGEAIKRIDNIKTSIESIRDFAAEMEMLSLNAAIVAIKAGDAGKTLNPITVELKKMANAAIDVIDDIVRTSDQLTEKYNLFRQISERQAESCRSEVESTSEQLALKYEGLQSSISAMVGRLDRIVSAVKDSKQPIGKIMNTLQVQDIVKQCTDHVRLSLKEASVEDAALKESAIAGIQPEQLLDIAAFQERVPQLCIQLLDDIDERLNESVADLSAEFTAVQSLISAVSACPRGTGDIKLEDTMLIHVEESFKNIENAVVDTATLMKNAANSWEELWSTALGLAQMLEILEKQFRQLKKLTNFHLINIPIKIEVARNSGLSKDGELAQRVEGLAEYINTEMKQSHKAILQDCQFLNGMVALMAKHRKDVEANFDTIARDIEDLLSNFYYAKEQVRTTFSHVCKHISGLDRLVQASLFGLDKISRLIEQNRELRHDLTGLTRIAERAKELVLTMLGAGDWELHNERLKSTIEKFTVLAHKKIAEDLYDISVEGGTQEGELALF